PFNTAHAIYGTGQTIWTTSDLTNADPSASSTGIVHWTVGANGIEETAVLGLWAPPSGNTILLSALGDLYGFAHQDLTVSPPQMFSNPAAAPTSLDFEQTRPTIVVRVTDRSQGANPIGVISTDAGLTWTAFPAMPPGSKGGGTIAIAPDGSSMVWATKDTASVWYSKNLGQTWAAAMGIGAQAQVASDRVRAGMFYGFSNGTLTMSSDGGATFTAIQTGLPAVGILTALPDAQGDLWLAGQEGGLFSNSGTSTAPALAPVTGIQNAYHLGFGKSAASSAKLALYLDGQIDGVWGLYRSTDGGSKWIQINDSTHQWGGFTAVCGDMRTFGTVYLGTGSGRGIIWGTSEN
ncbi:MAG: sialidase family protein, partial [Terracidiphilus sp.]